MFQALKVMDKAGQYTLHLLHVMLSKVSMCMSWYPRWLDAEQGTKCFHVYSGQTRLMQTLHSAEGSSLSTPLLAV